MADADLNLWEFLIAILAYQAIVGLAVYLVIRTAWGAIRIIATKLLEGDSDAGKTQNQ